MTNLDEYKCFTSAIGMIDNVVIHQDARVPWGDNTQNLMLDPATNTFVSAPTNLGVPAAGVTNVARGVFVGAQAAAFSCGAEEGPTGQPLRVRWVEELLDANNVLRITAGMIWGMHKTRFNSQDYSTIVLSTYATSTGV